MSPQNSFPPALAPFIQCPVCSSSLTNYNCGHCKTDFFELNGIQCLMPSGNIQKKIWQHQLAALELGTHNSLKIMEEILERYDILPSTRERTEQSYKTALASHESVTQLMARVGLTPEHSPELQQLNLPVLTEYYHHILQDWAWEPKIIQHKLERILSTTPKTQQDALLVLGAGAGRLSWELHKELKPNLTIATDINPLLLAAPTSLIKLQQGFKYFELNSFPQIGKPIDGEYYLSPPSDPNNLRDSWIPVAADVWHMPIKPNSLDIIITTWFMDVHGGDNKDLINLIYRWLKPGGTWINHGPLLYPRSVPFEQKYSAEELVDFMGLVGFDVKSQVLSMETHLDSPINARQQTEQIWTFCAEALAAPQPRPPKEGEPSSNMPPSWLLFHHLPIPADIPKPKASHPMVDLVVCEVDGKQSINQICERVAAKLPQGIDVKVAVTTLFGEILEEDAS